MAVTIITPSMFFFDDTLRHEETYLSFCVCVIINILVMFRGPPNIIIAPIIIDVNFVDVNFVIQLYNQTHIKTFHLQNIEVE